MPTIIQQSEAQEAKAFPVLLRHAPGTVLPLNERLALMPRRDD